ncbi:hypothetical protein DY000_02031975 [Brassica cretica]|uniref:Uncharacterized protein n=1 Tax=Brassica cretica TaxID=69181 RepID=A0ABQ7DW93_BRACR|nr:hypothetical protein DY000_02031975 [Brassica cretica]
MPVLTFDTEVLFVGRSGDSCEIASIQPSSISFSISAMSSRRSSSSIISSVMPRAAYSSISSSVSFSSRTYLSLSVSWISSSPCSTLKPWFSPLTVPSDCIHFRVLDGSWDTIEPRVDTGFLLFIADGYTSWRGTLRDSSGASRIDFINFDFGDSLPRPASFLDAEAPLRSGLRAPLFHPKDAFWRSGDSCEIASIRPSSISFSFVCFSISAMSSRRSSSSVISSVMPRAAYSSISLSVSFSSRASLYLFPGLLHRLVQPSSPGLDSSGTSPPEDPLGFPTKLSFFSRPRGISDSRALLTGLHSNVPDGGDRDFHLLAGAL